MDSRDNRLIDTYLATQSVAAIRARRLISQSRVARRDRGTVSSVDHRQPDVVHSYRSEVGPAPVGETQGSSVPETDRQTGSAIALPSAATTICAAQNLLCRRRWESPEPDVDLVLQKTCAGLRSSRPRQRHVSKQGVARGQRPCVTNLAPGPIRARLLPV